MAEPTVTVPVAQLKRLREMLTTAATSLAGDVDEYALDTVREALRSWANILNEAISIKRERDEPDIEALFDRVMQAVALQGGRQFAPTLDEAGVGQALAAIGEMVPALGAQPGAISLAQLREAVRVQDPVCTLVFERRLNKSAMLADVTERIECYPCPWPMRKGEVVTLDGGRWGRVTDVAHRGRCPVVTVRDLTVEDEDVPF